MMQWKMKIGRKDGGNVSMATTLEKIKGCMFGGAIGDALGYPVEFKSAKEIYRSI